MRALVTCLTVTLLFGLTSLASAMTAPMSDEQLTEASDLIVYGEVTEVVCNGEPTDNGQVTMTAYLATLTIEEVTKPEGDETTSVTLPFATMVYDEGSEPPSCGWAPSYLVGERGTFYLETGSSTEFYTLVSWNAFVADEDSEGEELPSCEGSGNPGTDAGPMPLPDSSDGEEDAAGPAGDATEVGPEPDTNPGDVETPPSDGASTTASTEDAGGPAEDAAAADATPGMQCEPDEECDMCGICSDEGQCMNPPSCPVCTSDSDCAEGETCDWIDSVTSECVSADDTDPGSDDSGSSDGGGCATGSSGGPLSVVFGLLALMAFAWRRRALTVPVAR